MCLCVTCVCVWFDYRKVVAVSSVAVNVYICRERKIIEKCYKLKTRKKLMLRNAEG